MAASIGVLSLPERRHLSWKAVVAMGAATALIGGAGFFAGWSARTGNSVTNEVTRPVAAVAVDPALRMSGIENPSVAGFVGGSALTPGIEMSGIENPSVASSFGIVVPSLQYSGYENPSAAWSFGGTSSGQAPTASKACDTTEKNLC